MISKIIYTVSLLLSFNVAFCQTYYPVASGNGILFNNSTNLITTDNDWSNIPFIRGFRGDGLAAGLDVDPRTITADGTSTPVVITANQTDPDTFLGDGFAEFEYQSPAYSVIAFRASNTASAPFLMIYLNTLGVSTFSGHNVLAFWLSDIDASSRNSAQQVVVQYRVGETGPFINSYEYQWGLPGNISWGGYLADATVGPNSSNSSAYCQIQLPAEVLNQPKVQVRIMTTNATGGNEWVAISNLVIYGGMLLPIQLHNFTASAKSTSVITNWNATTTSDSEYFEVERSTNGADYKKIGTMPAKATGQSDYNFNDVSPARGVNFYRLKLVNNNGAFTYSDIVKVNFAGIGSSFIISPNVATASVNIKIFTIVKAIAYADLIDAQGKLVKKIRLELSEGQNNLPVEINALPAGNYFMRLNLQGKIFTQGFIKG